MRAFELRKWPTTCERSFFSPSRFCFSKITGPVMRPTNEIFTSATDYCEVTTNYRRAFWLQARQNDITHGYF